MTAASILEVVAAAIIVVTLVWRIFVPRISSRAQAAFLTVAALLLLIASILLGSWFGIVFTSVTLCIPARDIYRIWRSS